MRFISAHAHDTKRSIVFRQAFRISRICSFEKDFEKHVENMSSCFHTQAYSKDLVQKKMKKVKLTSINRVKRQKGTEGATFLAG